jgi:hypothetical protein
MIKFLLAIVALIVAVSFAIAIALAYLSEVQFYTLHHL